MTPQEIDDKVKDLSQTYGVVNPVVLNVSDSDQAVGFLKEPGYDIILYMTDCMINKEMTKGAEAMVRACLIPEESDSRIMDKENYPKIAASFVLASFKLFKLYTSNSEVKKN